MSARRGIAVALPFVVAFAAGASVQPAPPAAGPPLVPGVDTSTARPAATPFGVGERMEYQVKFGAFSVGDGHMTVHDIESIRGHRSYHVSMAIQGRIRFVARADNRYESWMDVNTLASHRFIQDQDETGTQRTRQFEFYHDERRFERADGEESGDMITGIPLDDISFVYFARTLPLEVGKTYTLNQYFRPDRNPVILHVLRRDRIEVPAGTFNTIVVRPVIRTRGLFSEGGQAEIHFTDDDRRLMVYMQSRIPTVRLNLSLHLRDYTTGRPLQAFQGGVLPPGVRETSTPNTAH